MGQRTLRRGELRARLPRCHTDSRHLQRERRPGHESPRCDETSRGEIRESETRIVKISIRYQTQYIYSEPVSFSLHYFRLFPKTGRHLTVHRLAFQTNADADVHYRHDLFDNEIASVFYPGKSAL